MLEVFVHSGLLCCGIFVAHGSEATTSFRGLAVENTVELGITNVVLLLQVHLSHFDSNWACDKECGVEREIVFILQKSSNGE